MMSTVTFCADMLDPSSWLEMKTDDACLCIYDHFGGLWPEGAHVYLDRVEKKSDITPYDNASVERLRRASGHFFVVVYPAGIETILLVVALVVAAVAIGVSFLLRPSQSTPANNQNSPNNQLSDRQNTARPNGRIPDIFGQLWATFDLLAVPYRTFVGQFEYEHCYMCIGRGKYQFATVNGVLQIRDDMTPLQHIDGAQASIFYPGHNPTLGSSPDIAVGASITDPLVNLQVFTGVNGQLLQAPNISALEFGIRFRFPNIIENNVSVDFTTMVQPGDTLYLGGNVANDDLAHDPGAVVAAVHLGGIYLISSVTSTQIFLSSPSTVNANWLVLNTFSGSVSNYENPGSIMANNPFWVGGNTAVIPALPPFWLDHPEMTAVWCNFVAEQGSYKIDGTSGTQFEVDNTIKVGVTPCDVSGIASGIETFTNVTLFGSHTDKLAKGCTLKINVVPGAGGILIRAQRTTTAEIRGGWQNSDAVQWRDCYIVSALGAMDFGNVTTVQTVIKATPQATAIKERKMNALVTRMIFTQASPAVLVASTNAADIFYHMALDPFIGKLSLSELDVTTIYALAGAGGEIQLYFTTFPDLTTPTQFCFTFDDSKVSFEESIADLATSIFCTAYRRGGLLSLSFEKLTPNSTLLFNHRNKIPKSETRTVTFGTVTENDGIDLDYVEPNAPNYPNVDTTVTLHFPPDGSATNPKKVKTIGVRNVQQASILGWRLYWKLFAQNTAVEFECTEEAALLVLQDRILVADNTRSDTQDGEVDNQFVLELTLSQNIVFDARFSYSIFLQHPDETVESIPIIAGSAANKVILQHAPTNACVVDPNMYAKTTYMIVNDAPVRSAAFLVTEKSPKDLKTWQVKGVNYADLYYSHDGDFSTNMDVAAMWIEVMKPSPPPNIDVDGMWIEVIRQ